KSDYITAIKGLVTLYVSRGYPESFVNKWTKDHIQERWEKRLIVNNQETADVLVLKSEFNTAWNYFNATELGNTILGFWREWITRAKSGTLTGPLYPDFGDLQGDLTDADPDLLAGIKRADGSFVEVPDIRKIGIFGRKTIVS